MKKLILYAGRVGDFDGAYDWVPKGHEDDPDNALGFHDASWPDNCYLVVAIMEGKR